jgi:hypothetical protein
MKRVFAEHLIRFSSLFLLLAAGVTIAQQAKQAKPPAPAGINLDNPFTPPPDIKVESVQVAPFVQGVQFAVSPQGIHVAIPAPSGSRTMVMYDNTAGPKFDSLFPEGNGSSPIIFSPDGKRYAYCGALGTDWVVMVDGKELARANAGVGGAGTNNCQLGFTANSQHIYFLSIPGPNRPSHVFFDGKPGPGDVFDGIVTYSPDGNHFAYIGYDPASKRSQLIVDGQVPPYNAGAPQWSATGHLYTQRPVIGPNGGQIAVDVLYDGKTVMRANAVTLYMAPTGDMMIAKVTGAQGQPAFFTVGNKRIPGTDIVGGTQAGDPVFSPDGKHFAYRYSAGNQAFVFVDGVKGMLGYQRIDGTGVGNGTRAGGTVGNDGIAFSPDSSKTVYMGFNNNSDYLVYGGQESDAVPTFTEGAFSAVGGHFLGTGFGIVTLDGKILKLPNVVRNRDQAGNLGFSPDGSHYAFVARTPGIYTLYVDGMPQSAYYWAGSGGFMSKAAAAYAFSPDSKHIAYFCRSSNPAVGNDIYLCLDDKAVRLGGNTPGSNLMFTADSNHLIWTMNRPQSGWRAFMDGKPVAEGFGQLGDATWQPGPTPGSWAFLLQDNDGLKRVTLTPSAGTSFASFAGGASALPPGK